MAVVSTRFRPSVMKVMPKKAIRLGRYVLFLNGIVPDDAALDADNLARIKMPNRDGFVSGIHRRTPAPNHSRR